MKRLFEIPAEHMPDFAEILSENELANKVQGRNEDDDIVVEVNYHTSQASVILELIDWMDETLKPTAAVEDEDD